MGNKGICQTYLRTHKLWLPSPSDSRWHWSLRPGRLKDYFTRILILEDQSKAVLKPSEDLNTRVREPLSFLEVPGLWYQRAKLKSATCINIPEDNGWVRRHLGTVFQHCGLWGDGCTPIHLCKKVTPWYWLEVIHYLAVLYETKNHYISRCRKPYITNKQTIPKKRIPLWIPRSDHKVAKGSQTLEILAEWGTHWA